MTPHELMDVITFEADEQTNFYKELSDLVETKNKFKCIELLINHFNCDFDTARMVIDYVIDGISLPDEINTDLTLEQTIRNNQIAQDWQNKPKCITCGSTNIKKISTSAKVAGAVAFGLFSKTAKSQFVCNNCGCKW